MNNYYEEIPTTQEVPTQEYFRKHKRVAFVTKNEEIDVICSWQNTDAGYLKLTYQYWLKKVDSPKANTLKSIRQWMIKNRADKSRDAQHKKSLELLDKFITEEPLEFKKLVEEIDKQEFEGQTIDEYLKTNPVPSPTLTEEIEQKLLDLFGFIQDGETEDDYAIDCAGQLKIFEFMDWFKEKGNIKQEKE